MENQKRTERDAKRNPKGDCKKADLPDFP